MKLGPFLYHVGTNNPKAMLGIVPACNGLEEPVFVNGNWVLYVFDVFSRSHGYMDLNGEIFVDIEQTHLVAQGAIA